VLSGLQRARLGRDFKSSRCGRTNADNAEGKKTTQVTAKILPESPQQWKIKAEN